jgi:hypothetical protein
MPLNFGDLFAVGNVSLSNEAYEKMIKWGMVYTSWGSGNTFIILAVCQASYYYDAKSNGGAKDVNYRTYSCGG